MNFDSKLGNKRSKFVNVRGKLASFRSKFVSFGAQFRRFHARGRRRTVHLADRGGLLDLFEAVPYKRIAP